MKWYFLQPPLPHNKFFSSKNVGNSIKREIFFGSKNTPPGIFLNHKNVGKSNSTNTNWDIFLILDKTPNQHKRSSTAIWHNKAKVWDIDSKHSSLILPNKNSTSLNAIQTYIYWAGYQRWIQYQLNHQSQLRSAKSPCFGNGRLLAANIPLLFQICPMIK